MAVKWPHPPLAIPPVSPDSNPDLDPGPGPEPTAPPPPRIPPRPYSAEFNISTDRFIALSSPMLQSTGSARQSAAPVSERRESAPSPSHSSFFSPLSSPVAGINKTEQPRQRPRSNSHIQLPLYSPASQHRPLPALPVTKRAVTPTEDGIKVPVDDDRSYNSVPSPRNLNANRLHPNNFPHPHSPQFIPKDLTRNSYQHRNSIDSVPGSAMASVHPLEYQSSMSSSGSSTSNSRYLAYLRQPMNLRGESNTFIPAQTQELLHRYDDGPGHSPGQLSREGGQQLQYEQANASASGSRVSNERSLHHYPLNHMQDGAVQSSKQRPTGPSTSSFTGSQQSSVRLPNRNMSLSSSLSSTTEYNSAASLSSFSSPSLFHQEYPGHSQSNNSADLLSYYPPPPLSNITTVQPHYFGSSTESQSVSVATESPTPSSAKLPTNSMPANKSSTLPPNHNNRRHSSGLHKLSIKTHHLYTVKKGPSTADVAGPGNRHLEPENTIKGTAQSRPRLKQPAPSSSSYLLPRQSPNHLVIPQAPQPPSAYSTQQHSYSNAQHPLDTRQQHQAQVQHQPSHSQGRQRMPSTVRSPSSPGMTSPSSGPWLFETMQDRTAMSLMQQYLIQPDDPDSEVDIAMQIMISQAAVDSKGFEVLIPQTVESIKRHHATLSSRIAALTARLSLESKIREAAQSLLRLHADNKKLARQASDHLEAANRKVDQVATELWKLTQLAADLQRTLLQHTSGVLALGVVRLEDQGRREREMYMAQLQDARIGQDVEQQFGMMSRTIMNLESDALEAQSLLEDKDRAIERLMHQLDHQRDLFIKLDEQQQKTIAISQSQQKNMDALIETHDAKTVAKLSSFLNTVQHRLQAVLQQQQGSSGRGRQEREGTGQTWSSETTVGCQVSKREASKPLVREDSVSSEPSDAYTAGTTAVSETLAGSKPSISPSSVLGDGSAHFSIDSICSTLDALENRVSESQQKMTVLTGEIGLLRRQSVALSESRNNSIRIKNFSVSRGQAAEDTVRAALEKSLKDALLAKQMAQQELENERQRWQEDQSHRIKALEESLVAVEDMDKGVDANCNGDEAVQELRRQLREAIDEIDILNQQHQSNLKDMRQLFDIVPDPRRKSHMQLYSSHQQLQQQKITGTPGDKTALSESTSSLVPAGVIGFSMEALIGRVKELVARSEQIEQDNLELREQLGKMGEQSRRNSNQEILTKKQHTPEDTDLLDSSLKQRGQSTRVLKSDLERLHASAEMVELLEKELELLKQHTDVLMDENARLAELAAAGATGTPVNSRSSLFGRVVHKPHQSDELDELQEIIRAKDKLLRERDQVVQEQEKALLQMQADMAKIKEGNAVDCALNSNSAVKLSPFDVNTLEELRAKCGKLEGEMGELRMIIAALESVSGGPGTGSQLLDSLSVTSSAQSPPSSFWFSSGLARSFNFGSLPQKHPEESPSSAMSPVPSASDVFGAGQQGLDSSANALSPTSNNTAIAGATAALRKEFRRAMGELREEKDKAVRKEVEERRRLERELRELRRELQTIQTSTHA